jgi:hypothetical protein
MRANISSIIKSGIRLIGFSSDKVKPTEHSRELAQEKRVDREMLARLERYMETLGDR